MFTGLIEALGRVSRCAGSALEVFSPDLEGGVKIGDSVAVMGACLTVTSFSGPRIRFDLGPITREKTTLGKLTPGRIVNLERALTPETRLGGHIVLGHINTLGTIAQWSPNHGAWTLEVVLDHEWERYLLTEGSVAVDGVSLTIASLSKGGFRVQVLDLTKKLTTLQYLRVGDRVNIEVDSQVRALEKLSPRLEPRQTLSDEKLKKWGYV